MLLLTDFGTRGDPNILRNMGTVYGDLVKSHRFGPFWPFFHATLTDFQSRGDTNVRGTKGSGYENLVKTRRFCPFWPVL